MTDDGRVTGWVLRRGGADKLLVELWVGDLPVLTTRADGPAPPGAGAVGDGHGFRFDLLQAGLPEHEGHVGRPVVVRVAGTGETVPGAAVACPGPTRLAPDGTFPFAFGPRPACDGLFFGPDEVPALVVRRRRAPFDAIAAGLRARLDILAQDGPDSVAGKSLRFRGFTWRNALQDACLGQVVFDEARDARLYEALVERLLEDCTDLDGYFPDEVNLGFACTGLALSLDLARAAGCPPAAEAACRTLMTRIADRLWAEQEERYWGHRSRDRLMWNHSVIGYATIGLATLSAGVTTPADRERLASAARRMQSFLRHGVDEAGMTREGLSYAGFTWGIVGPFLNALFRTYPVRHAFHAAPGCDETKYDRLLDWYRFDRQPGIPALSAWNDAMREPHQALRGALHLPNPALAGRVAGLWHDLVGAEGDAGFGAATRYAHGLLFDSYCFLAPERAALDLPTSRHYPTDGYVYARSDWSPQAATFSFRSGPFTLGVHGQADTNAFQLSAFGRPLFIDSGTANSRAPDSASQWAAHSVLAINGHGYAVAGRGLGVSGRILERETGPDHVYVAGDAWASYGRPEIRRAVRHACFLGAVGGLVLFDEVVLEGPLTELEWRFQVDPRFPTMQVVGPGRYALVSEDGSGEAALVALLRSEGEVEASYAANAFGGFTLILRMSAPCAPAPFLILPFRGTVPVLTASVRQAATRIEVEAGWEQVRIGLHLPCAPTVPETGIAARPPVLVRFERGGA